MANGRVGRALAGWWPAQTGKWAGDFAQARPRVGLEIFDLPILPADAHQDLIISVYGNWVGSDRPGPAWLVLYTVIKH